MSHEITATDNIVLAKQSAWHGLGVVLPDTFTPQEALEIGGIDWNVSQRAIYCGAGDIGSIEAPSHLANVRDDTNEILSIVGSNYSVLQNRDLAIYVEDVCGDNVRLETAGTLRGGREVFFLARMDSFDAAPGDTVERYAMFSNTHDGTRAFTVFPTSVRTVCMNTLRMALAGKRSGIAVRHTSGLLESIEAARDALTQAVNQGEAFRDSVELMAKQQMTKEEREAFYAQVYQVANRKRIPRNPKDEQEARDKRKALRVISDWVALLDDEKNLIGGIGGTVWASLNSITEWSDHQRTVRVTATAGDFDSGGDVQARQEARTYSNWLGSSNDFKAQAYTAALAAITDAPTVSA